MTFTLVTCVLLLDLCPADWHFYNGKCYFPSETKASWSVASAACDAEGAKLTSIIDPAELEFLTSIS